MYSRLKILACCQALPGKCAVKHQYILQRVLPEFFSLLLTQLWPFLPLAGYSFFCEVIPEGFSAEQQEPQCCTGVPIFLGGRAPLLFGQCNLAIIHAQRV